MSAAGNDLRGPRGLARFAAHVKRLWPSRPYLPLLPFVLYALYSAARHDLRPEHLILIVAVAVLAYTGPRTKELLFGLYPLGLVGILFDGMRPFQRLGLTESRVHVCDVRALEAQLFGLSAGDGAERITLHDYFQTHHTLALDLYCAIPYATFILVCVACATFLYVKDRPAMLRFAWGFFLLNLAGFITYHVIPAAPPWYFHAHGCAVDLGARASEGVPLGRVDAFLGVAYFRGMYSKAASVFGAIPSLHCAYPLLVILEGWAVFGRKLRAAAVVYYVSMVFSAVYLDHHWVIDAVIGGAYAVLVFVFLRFAAPRLARMRAEQAVPIALAERAP
jgi:hypothetical protein